MTLSLLRSCRRATDNDLISRVRQIPHARARLSRRYRTQAPCQRNPSSTPVAFTFHSPVACHQLFNSPIRRLYSHQTAAERSEPSAVSLTPADATTSFQERRLRSRQISEAKTSELTAIEATQRREGKSKPHKAPGRKDKKLGKVACATQKVRPRGEVEVSNNRTEENQDFIKDSSVPEEFDDHYNYWGPAVAADAEHLQAVQTALSAARKVEDLQCRAKKATDPASAAELSHDEELAALVAKQAANLAAEKEKAYEAVRAELRAASEVQPLYWVRTKKSNFSLGSKLRAIVDASCRVCHEPHSLSHCPLLFKALDCKEKRVTKRGRRLFKDKLALDEEFREVITYIRSNFLVSRGPTVEVLALSRSATKNAPASAIKYLQEFDNRVGFRNTCINGESGKHGPALTRVSRAWERQAGYYITEDDDGMPIAILFPTNAPSNIDTDPTFWHEIQKIRSFTAHWRKGGKSSTGQDPFADIPSISIIICAGRWHRTMAGSTDPFRCVLSLFISNESLWDQGLYYKGIHIGTKDDEITSEYDWWSHGLTDKSVRWTNKSSTPRHAATSDAHILFASRLLLATLRSVEEPVRPILDDDVRRNPEGRLLYRKYLRSALPRGANKYGKASVQYRILRTYLSKVGKDEITAMMGEQWAPSWRTLMRLGHDKQELGPVQPRPLPRTLCRRRLLHPRHSPTSTSSTAVSTDRLSEAQGHPMRSILSPDIAPVTEAGGSSGVENPGPRPESTPRASQPKTAKNRMRRILSPVDYASYNTTEKSETGENSARRVSTPWTTSRSHNPGYVPKGLLSRLSATRPELEVDTSALEAAGRDWVNFRRSFRSRRSEEKKKPHKTKIGHELPVTDGSSASSF